MMLSTVSSNFEAGTASIASNKPSVKESFLFNSRIGCRLVDNKGMRSFLSGLALSLLIGAALSAQTLEQWQTATEIPKVSFEGLTSAQKTIALKLMGSTECT